MSGDGGSDGVVVHLNEAGEARHEAVTQNVASLLDDLGDLGDAAEVELVVHGPAVTLCLSDSPQVKAVGMLIARGVVVAVCENTLRSQGIDMRDLAPGVVMVSSGIGELVRRQRQGWAYVRP